MRINRRMTSDKHLRSAYILLIDIMGLLLITELIVESDHETGDIRSDINKLQNTKFSKYTVNPGFDLPGQIFQKLIP